MIPRSHGREWLLVSVGLAAAASTPWGSVDGAAVSRRALFSEQEVETLYRRAGEGIRPFEPALAADLEEPVIELEPFVVQGDDTLLLAAIRRHLELGPPSIRRRVSDLAPEMGRQAQFSGRASERFLQASNPGRPSDASTIVPVGAGAMIDLARQMAEAMKLIRPEEERP